MSRIGKKLIAIPDGVEVNITATDITVKGKKGTLKECLVSSVEIKKEENNLSVKCTQENRQARANQGLMRSLVLNMVIGVTEGYQKRLNIVGVGYKADIKGSTINLNLGHSHLIKFSLPEGIQAKYDKNGNFITLSSCDKHLIGETSAQIRKFRPPEPYKGKGVMYADEVIRRKVGKTGAK